jgi:hypothetical protein
MEPASPFACLVAQKLTPVQSAQDQSGYLE